MSNLKEATLLIYTFLRYIVCVLTYMFEPQLPYKTQNQSQIRHLQPLGSLFNFMGT